VKSILISLVLALLGLAAGCEPPGRDRPEPAGAGPRGPVRLEIEDAGKTVELEKGQGLVVVLEGNLTTGYAWEVAEVDEQVLQPGEITFKPQSDLEGAPGAFTIEFRAAGEGQTSLGLVYRRSWEKDVKPLETFTVQVVVR